MRCASFAIRSSFVETLAELDVSFIFPSNGSMPRCRSLLGRVPRVGSPASALVLRQSDFQLPHLAHSRLLSGSGYAGESWISLVPRRPSPYVPRLSDPGGTGEAGLRDDVPTLRFTGAAFRACRRVGFHHVFLSGSNTAAHMLAVYASQPGSPLHHARLATGWQPYLGQAGVQPARSLRQVCSHVLAFTWFPPDRSLKAHGKIKRPVMRIAICENNT